MTDVTFGDTTVHGLPVSFGNGVQVATKYTLTGSDPAAVLKDIALCAEASGSHTADFILGVWRDSPGLPTALVGYGLITPPVGAFASQFLSVLGTGNTITLVDSGGIMDDGDYWVGPWQGPGSSYNLDYQSVPGGAQFASPGGAAPSNPFGSPTATAFQPVANATVTFTPPTDPPTNVTPPVVTGSPVVGHTLETTDGAWIAETSITYQWQIDCGGGFIDISGETTNQYTTVPGDLGCVIACLVTAHNVFGDTSQISNSIGPIVANTPAAMRFCESPAWRFVITNMQSEVLTTLDRLATEKSVVYTLNAPAIATGVVPSDSPEINIPHTDGEPFLAEGNRLLYGFRNELIGSGSTARHEWVVRYAGMVLQLEDIADSDNANSHYTAFDPLKYLFARPVQTLAGDPIGINGLSFSATRVDEIIGTLILNTIVNNGSVHIDPGAFYGGTGFWQGTIETLPQIDINFQQGTSLGDAIKQLTDQNLVDILLTPVYDPRNRPGTLCDLSILAQAGAVQNDAIFAWDKPSRSLVGISRLLDFAAAANRVKYFAGAGGTASGGQNIPVQSDSASIARAGEWWSQLFWPGQNVANAVQALAEAALDLQKNGKETVTISPVPGCTPLPFQEFYLGDRVPVYASNRFREEIPTGAIQYQRIYGIPIDIADDSTEMIQQMLTSELQ